MRAALVLLAVCSGGCAQVARIAVVRPVDESVAAGKTVVVGGVIAAAADHVDRHDLEIVEGELVKALLDSGRYRVVERRTRAWRLEDVSSASVAQLGSTSGVERVAALRAVRIQIRRRRHHVHDYFDGSASGEASLLDARSGHLLRFARESVRASTRVEYSTESEVRDLLAERLASRLAGGLIYEKAARLVELEDPGDGALRAGIELAKQGRWRDGIAAWSPALVAGRHAAAAHFNIAVAHHVLGELEPAREHFAAAHALEPGNRRYRNASRALETSAD